MASSYQHQPIHPPHHYEPIPNQGVVSPIIFPSSWQQRCGLVSATAASIRLFLAVVAICIELDYAAVVKSFYGFKGFIPRSLLLFFVSVITGAHPLHAKEANYNNNNTNGGGNGDDDNDDYYDETAFIESQIPHSAINFQMVTSFIL